MARKPKILVVDDERHITDFYSALLTTYGYGHIAVNSAKTAVNLLAREKFDLLITDLVMPEMGGLALLQHVNEHHPEVRRILISGLLRTHREADNLLEEGLAHEMLAKPCNIETFMDAVTKQLDEAMEPDTQAA